MIWFKLVYDNHKKEQTQYEGKVQTLEEEVQTEDGAEAESTRCYCFIL